MLKSSLTSNVNHQSGNLTQLNVHLYHQPKKKKLPPCIKLCHMTYTLSLLSLVIVAKSFICQLWSSYKWAGKWFASHLTQLCCQQQPFYTNANDTVLLTTSSSLITFCNVNHQLDNLTQWNVWDSSQILRWIIEMDKTMCRYVQILFAFSFVTNHCWGSQVQLRLTATLFWMDRYIIILLNLSCDLRVDKYLIK